MKIGFLFTCIFLNFFLSGQSTYQYRISFKDKGNGEFRLDEPLKFLSLRSVDRRIKQGVEMDESDLPVSNQYIEEIKEFSVVKVRSKSKWFNDIVIELTDTSVLNKIRLKDFVASVEALPGSIDKSLRSENKEMEVATVNVRTGGNKGQYGSAKRQVSMLGAEYFHFLGYKGKGVRIAVIDAGFTEVKTATHFKTLFAENRVVDTYDFVLKQADVYAHSSHGTLVLSTMASNSPGILIGTAPESEYILLRSEDGYDEYLLEEYFWVEAAEFADSAGADLINTSLGYTTFTDSNQNHAYADLNGTTTRISLGSEKAFEKGMLLFNSAGNSGSSAWQKINAPADAENVITVGGADATGILAVFSSRGPTADQRLKPDLSAMAKDVVVGRGDGSVGTSNGTSFSSPILTGGAACLLQANPMSNRNQIRSALVQSGDRYHFPDTNYGYGIPNLILADEILKGSTHGIKTESSEISLFPNPYVDFIMLKFASGQAQQVKIKMHNSMGKLVYSRQIKIEEIGLTYLYLKEDLPKQSGLYLFSFESVELKLTLSVIRE